MVTSSESQDIQTLLEEGSQLRKDGQLEAALEKIQQALAINPDFPTALNQMGAIHLQKQEFEQAIASYQKAIELNPNNAGFYNGLGDAYLKAKNPTEAASTFQKAIELNPKAPASHKRLGDALQQLGQLERAIAAYQKAIELNPNNAGFYNGLGDAYLKAKQPAEAISAYEKALELKPDLPPNVRKKLGDALGKIGKLEAAIEAYQQAIELKPNNASFKAALEDAKVKLGKLNSVKPIQYKASLEIKIKFKKKLLDLDYFVFSSHKTGTQTLTHTLNTNGFKCRHCHGLKDIGIENGSFREYLEHYLELNHKKLNVISVFREPIARHISSFFQGYGTKPLISKKIKHKHDTIIYKYTIEELQKLFISELNNQSLIGYKESLHRICKELQIKVDQLNYDGERQLGLYETDNIKLYIFRFDVLFANFDYLLTTLTGSNIDKKDKNTSESKWYQNIYSDFKASLVLPRNTISKVYESKRDIINVIYSGDFESILNQAFVKYSN